MRVCVRVCACVGGWVGGGWEAHACVRVCVCVCAHMLHRAGRQKETKDDLFC